MELFKNFMRNPKIQIWSEMIEDENSTIIWIDHREYDEDIVQYVEDVLKTGKLSATLNDKDNKQGFEIIIKFDNDERVIQYEGEGSDRDTTIITLNEVLKEKGYEMRLCNHSIGNDTLAFLAGTKKQFEELEREFTKQKTDKFLSIITKDKKMFSLSITEVGEIIKELGLD